MKKHIPILGFSAWSGVGKTTLLEQLIPCLNALGISVGLVKHAHHTFDVDKPGKDSYRLRKAGANPVLLISDKRLALMQEAADDTRAVSLDDAIAALPLESDYDLLLVEGFKTAAIPKIIIHRPEAAQTRDLPAPLEDPNVVALASNQLEDIKALYPKSKAPLLDLNSVEKIANFIHQWLDRIPYSKAVKQGHGLSFADGLKKVLHTVQSLTETEILSLAEASGRALAETIKSKIAVPGDNNSAMDGYACRYKDLMGSDLTASDLIDSDLADSNLTDSNKPRLQLVGASACGLPFAEAVNPGQCVRILTGGIIPAGCDMVVMQEQCQLDGELVIFNTNLNRPFRKMQHIRLAGEDIGIDTVVAEPGQVLSPALLGVLASVGLMEVSVYRRPKIALITNGNELVSLGNKLERGQYYDSNRYTLMSMLAQHGVDVLDMGIVGDDPAELAQVVTFANTQADLIISTGGISVGDADYVKPVMRQLGEIIFSGLNIKPGHPVTLAKLPDSLFFGLPGNPVAVMVCFEQLVLPAIKALGGMQFQKPLTVIARLEEKVRKLPGRLEFVRGIYRQNEYGHYTVRRAGKQGSAILSTMARANCFILLDESCGGLEQGQLVQIQAFMYL